MFVHRLFHPVIFEMFQLFGKVEGFFAAVIVEGVEHQRHVGAKGFAHGGTCFNVSFGAWRTCIGGLLGVKFEGWIATFATPQCKVGVIFRRY